MPSKNPRLTLTLDHEIAFVLRRLSALTGESQAALVSELLEGNKHAFVRLISSLEKVGRQRADLVGAFSQDLHRSQDVLEARLHQMMEEEELQAIASRDDRTMELPLELDSIKRRKGRVAPAVGPEQQKAKRAAQGTKAGALVSSRRSGTPTY